ncbi:MAG: HNH endonuclease [Candidatus Omnitrophica bacterium]|nr:HNH endonuclease [Candidatus Omnitrophota bacterium]
MPSALPKAVSKLLKTISNKRARVVIDRILEKGFITTEELEKKYGYSHPPRAARDVREAGIPLETFRVKSSDGRSIAAYKFGDLAKIQRERLGGRTVFSRAFKKQLFQKHKGQCGICSAHLESRYLQIDHRIPYEVAGEGRISIRKPKDYMLLCGPCNRAKSWSCEHCQNLLSGKAPQICLKCYWASPKDYVHVALKEIRRADIVWEGDEVETYDQMKKKAQAVKSEVPAYVKRIVTGHVQLREVRP